MRSDRRSATTSRMQSSGETNSQDLEALGASATLALGNGWIAIHKPDWMSAHNASPDTGTVDAISFTQRILASHAEVRRQVRPEPGFRPAPAHRLDVGTSGVLIMSCSRAEATRWPIRLQSSAKNYVAITKAQRESPILERELRWTWPLSDKAEGRRDPQGPAGVRKPCETVVRFTGRTQWFARIEARIETGRTHQIRRHAVLAGCPIVGDRRYVDAKHADMIAERYGFDRLALHARELVFSETVAKELGLTAIGAPEPAEFQTLMNPAITGSQTSK